MAKFSFSAAGSLFSDKLLGALRPCVDFRDSTENSRFMVSTGY
jgi:hypothetical protein